jgi:hypothetical protein
MSAPLSAAILKGVGTTAGGNHFNIELQCSGGLSESGYANIRPHFSGTLATKRSESRGSAERKRPEILLLRDWCAGYKGRHSAGIQQKI